MRAYFAFIKKEYMESVRTYRFLVLGTVFLLLAFLSPIGAKYMPDIISAFLPSGVVIQLAEPSAMDAWMQFMKNFSQIGLFAAVIVYSTLMSGEYARGALIMVLTKGMSRKSVILAKFTCAVCFITVVYLVCVGVCAGYAWFFWGEDWRVSGLWSALAGMWCFIALLLAVVMLGGALFRSSYGCLLFTGAIVVAQMIGSIIPKAGRFFPVTLLSDSTAILNGQTEGMGRLVVITILAAVLCLTGAVLVFEKKKL